MKLRIGSSRADCGGELINVKNIIVHPGWGKSNEGPYDNDIAILELEEAFEFSNKTEPIELIGKNEVLRVGDTNVVSGWGWTFKHPNEFPPPLQAANLPTIDRDECERSLRMFSDRNVTERMICAGFLEGGR